MGLDFFNRGDIMAEIGLEAPSVMTGPSLSTVSAGLISGIVLAGFTGCTVMEEKSSPFGGSQRDSPVLLLK
jgi:hypothetical protein